MPNFFKDISYVDPTKFVNDENFNRPLKELNENINFLLNFVNGNKELYQGIFGNLIDFDAEGRRVTHNGGRYDSFKKVHLWTALEDLRIVNDNELFWDHNNEMMVYAGFENTPTTEPRKKWIERVVYIPETLRNQYLIFSIKAGLHEEKMNWTKNTGKCGYIAIEITGSDVDIKKVIPVGQWNNFDYFAQHQSYKPEMVTNIIPFKTSNFTKSIKIKIFRIPNDNLYLHINKIFIGLPHTPYQTDIETFDWSNIDINELYDFYNGVSKHPATHILGHKTCDHLVNIQGNDLLYWYIYNITLRNIFYFASAYKNISNTPVGSIFIEDFLDLNILADEDDIQGTILCNTNQKVYTISHASLSVKKVPIISIEMPTEESQVIVGNVTNVQDTQFTVVLSNFPPENGYKIHWFLGNVFFPKKAIQLLHLPHTLPPTNDVCISGGPSIPYLTQTEIDNIFKYQDE